MTGRRSGESTRSDVAAEKQHAGTRDADPRGQPETGTSARSDAGAGQTDASGVKAGTSAGTRNETARRRVIAEDLMKAGLSIRMISEVTDIPRSSVHRATRAVTLMPEIGS
jgi:hypothetical protein